MTIFLTGSSGDSGSSDNNADGSSDNNAKLITCDSDLSANQKIDVNDSIILYALVEHSLSSSNQSFQAFFDTLVSNGQIPNIDISGLDFTSFPSDTICYDYDQSGDVSNFDVEILSAFVAYMKKINKSEIDVTDANKFKLFLDILETQGLLNVPSLGIGVPGNTPPIMLPTISTDDRIYYTDETWIPKVTEEDGAYDETNSLKGSQVVDNDMNRFLVGHPGVKTYNQWTNGQPSYWLNTGLVTLFSNLNYVDNLDGHNYLNPPVTIIRNRTLPSAIIPMGTPNVFNSKTIASSGSTPAVSWHYQNSGVVYIYKMNDGFGGMEVGIEVQVPGDFSAGLPVIHLGNNQSLFVSNPLETLNPKIYVYGGIDPWGGGGIITTEDSIIEPPVSTPSTTSGFGSSMIISDDNTRLFVSSPLQKITKLGNIDHYDTGMIDVPCGAVFVYKKNTSTSEWDYDQTIIPHDIDDYIANDFDSGSTLDLQFGYSLETKGDKLFIGSPRSYSVASDRREGAVYVYTINSSECVYHSKVTHDDAKFDTTGISSGNFNFGISVAAHTNYIQVAHQIPSQGTFVTKYSLISGEYQMDDPEDFEKVSNQIITGMLAINSGGSAVFGSQNTLKAIP